MRVGFHTFGCKLNQHETEALASAFRGGGFSVCGTREDADLYIVNTCTVTSAGDHKARALVRSLLRGHPGVPVIVTGCSAQLEAAALARLGSDVVVVPQDRKSRLLGLPDFLRARDGADLPPVDAIRSFAGAHGTTADPFAFRITEPSFHTRAFLKVQDGCDRHCAYCRVPLARGPSVSLGADEAVRRAADLEERGFREIVVTGVNVSAWREVAAGPARLVESLLAGTAEGADSRIFPRTRVDRRGAGRCARRPSHLPPFPPARAVRIGQGSRGDGPQVHRRYRGGRRGSTETG